MKKAYQYPIMPYYGSNMVRIDKNILNAFMVTSTLTAKDLKDLNLLQKIDEQTTLTEGKAWPITKSKAFHDLITNLMNQQVTLSTDYLKESEANQIMKADFLQGIEPQLDQVIYSAAPDIASYAQSFYDLGKENGFKDMAVDAFTGQSDTQALYTLTQYDFGLVRNLSDDLKNEIQYCIWNGVAENHGIPTIAEALQNTTLESLQVGNRVIDVPTRAMMIAKTEAVRANNQGLLLSFKQYGVQMVDIITSPGVCDDCQEIADEGPYPIDKIPDGGPPFHPNCECTLIAASDPVDDPTDPTSYFNLVNGDMVNVPTVSLLSAI